MAGDLPGAEKGESGNQDIHAEVAKSPGEKTNDSRATEEELENLGESSQSGEIDEATVAQLAEMSVDMIFGTDVLGSEAENEMEATMADMIEQIANGMSGDMDGTDAFQSTANLIQSLDVNNIQQIADALLSNGMGSGLSFGVSDNAMNNDWLMPTHTTKTAVTKLAGDGGVLLGVSHAVKATPLKGAFGTAGTLVDVSARLGSDLQTGQTNLGTGGALAFGTTAIMTGAMIGGPAGAAIGAVVGLVGWWFGNKADEADAIVHEKKGETIDTSAAEVATDSEPDVEADPGPEPADAPSTPKDGPTVEEQMRMLRYLLSTSPAFRESMRWIQQSKAKGDIDPPRAELQDLGDTTRSDISGNAGFVNPGTSTSSVGTGSPDVPPSEGGDIDFGPDVVQSFDANHRPGESDVPTDVGRDSGTVASPATNNDGQHTKGTR